MKDSASAKQHVVLAAYLLEIRSRGKLTRQQVAERLGTSELCVEEWESGSKQIDLVELRAYCSAVGIPLSEFIIGFEAAISDPASDSQ